MVVREGFPEELTDRLRTVGRKHRNPQRAGLLGRPRRGQLEGTSSGPMGPTCAEGEESKLQMRTEVGRTLGCLVSTHKEGGLALQQPNQTEKCR